MNPLPLVIGLSTLFFLFKSNNAQKKTKTSGVNITTGDRIMSSEFSDTSDMKSNVVTDKEEYTDTSEIKMKIPSNEPQNGGTRYRLRSSQNTSKNDQVMIVF